MNTMADFWWALAALGGLWWALVGFGGVQWVSVGFSGFLAGAARRFITLVT